ncbi:hypothetical protein HKX48_005831 [Thoreauomyces humboldtii]|nr:hypothetical protein HKX48_005831 [Thoreauomyces humboldtii]
MSTFQLWVSAALRFYIYPAFFNFAAVNLARCAVREGSKLWTLLQVAAVAGLVRSLAYSITITYIPPTGDPESLTWFQWAVMPLWATEEICVVEYEYTRLCTVVCRLRGKGPRWGLRVAYTLMMACHLLNAILRTAGIEMINAGHLTKSSASLTTDFKAIITGLAEIFLAIHMIVFVKTSQSTPYPPPMQEKLRNFMRSTLCRMCIISVIYIIMMAGLVQPETTSVLFNIAGLCNAMKQYLVGFVTLDLLITKIQMASRKGPVLRATSLLLPIAGVMDRTLHNLRNSEELSV